MSVPGTLHTVTHIFMPTLKNMLSPSIYREETEAQRGYSPKITSGIGIGAKTRTQEVCAQSPHFFFGKIIFLIYVFMRDRERERERENEAEGEAAPCREPDVGLNPRAPGSHPGLKADALPLSHPGVPGER